MGKYGTATTLNNLYYLSSNPPAGFNGLEWLTTPINAAPTCEHVIATNVIAVLFLPVLSPNDEIAAGLTGSPGTYLSPVYAYDSTATNAISTVTPPNQYSYVSPYNSALNPQNQLPPGRPGDAGGN